MVNFYSSKLGKNVQQISKRKARKMFADGVTIWLKASNMSFDNPFYQNIFDINLNRRIELQNQGHAVDLDFDVIVNSFEYYNCNNYCGRYSQFFVGI